LARLLGGAASSSRGGALGGITASGGARLLVEATAPVTAVRLGALAACSPMQNGAVSMHC
jgi:hypothetical protein